MPTNIDVPTTNTESLIAETLTVRLGLRGTNIRLITNRPFRKKEEKANESEADAIEDALKAICDAPEHTVVSFCGRDHRIVRPHDANPDQGTQVCARPGSRYAVQIVLAPVDEPAQQISVRYALVKNARREEGDPEYFLEASGNPTTIMTRNNVSPVTVANPKDGVIPEFPSSTPRVMRTANRILFKLLETTTQQVTDTEDDLFGELTAKAIDRGDFTIVRSQWCCYFPVDNVPGFLQFLAVLFGHTIATTDGIVDLASHLGLRFHLWTDRRTHRVTGVLFEKRHGRKSVFSLVFYDKQKRVAQMRQGPTLTKFEAGLIRENVRFDITAHGPGIMEIIAEARRFLKKLRKEAPKFLEEMSAQQFLDGTPKQTAWWFDRACYVLSFKPTNGVRRRGSFADWLVPAMVKKELRLTSIVRCTPEGLRTFIALDDPVAKAWYSTERYDSVAWASQLADKAGVGKTFVYERRNAWLKEYNIDIAIPYAFYRDLEFFGPSSLAKPETRAALVAAIGQRDGEDTLRLLEEASTNFFAQMADVVRKNDSGAADALADQASWQHFGSGS